MKLDIFFIGVKDMFITESKDDFKILSHQLKYVRLGQVFGLVILGLICWLIIYGNIIISILSGIIYIILTISLYRLSVNNDLKWNSHE